MKKIFSKFTKERIEDYQIETSICLENEKKYVLKRGLNEKSKIHVIKMDKTYELYKKLGIDNLNKCEIVQEDAVKFEFLTGESLNNKLINAVMKRDKDKVLELVDKYNELVNEITKKLECTDFDNSDNFVNVFGNASDLLGVKSVKNIIFDLIFENLIEENNKYTVIDYEWYFDFAIPVEFVKFRAIWGFYAGHEKLMRDVITLEEMLDRALVDKNNVELYKKLNMKFIDYVYGADGYQNILQDYKKANVDILNDSIRDAVLSVAYDGVGENNLYTKEVAILDGIEGILEKNRELFDDYQKFFKITRKSAHENADMKKPFLTNEIFETEITNCISDLSNTIVYYKDMAEKKDEICTKLINNNNDVNTKLKTAEDENAKLRDENAKLRQELDYIKSTKVYRYGLKGKVDKYNNSDNK